MAEAIGQPRGTARGAAVSLPLLRDGRHATLFLTQFGEDAPDLVSSACGDLDELQTRPVAGLFASGTGSEPVHMGPDHAALQAKLHSTEAQGEQTHRAQDQRLPVLDQGPRRAEIQDPEVCPHR